MDRIKGMIMVVISAVGYGLMPLFAHFATSGNASVESMLFGRFFIAFLLLSLFLLATKISIRISIKQLITLAIVAIVGLVATTQMLFYSYRMMDVSRATALHFIYPVAVVIYAVGLKMEKMTIGKLIALMLGSGGVWFLVNNSQGELGSFMGVVLAILSGITYAVYVVGVALPNINTINRWVISFYTSFFASVGYFGLAVFRDELAFQVAPIGWIGILGLAVISTILAQVLFIQGISIIGPFKAAILSTFEPLVGILVGLLVFHETMGLVNIFGVLLIVGALLLVILGREKNRIKIIWEKAR